MQNTDENSVVLDKRPICVIFFFYYSYFFSTPYSPNDTHWIDPRIFHYISFALHFICITLHLHLKIMPRQHEMHDTSRYKCHALHLHFMK